MRRLFIAHSAAILMMPVMPSLARSLALIALCVSSSGAQRPLRASSHPKGVLSRQITGLGGRPFAIRVSAKGVVYITQQDANSVATFDLARDVRGRSIAVGEDPGDVVFTRDGATAFVSAYHGGGVHVIDVAKRREIAMIPVSDNAYRLALSADEGRLFVSSTDGSLYVVSVAERRVSTSVRLGSALQGLALSPSGRSLVVTSTGGRVWKLDANALEIMTTGVVRGTPQDVAVSRDESEIYVASESGTIDVLDGASLAGVARVSLDGMAPFGLALTPDDAQLYVTSPVTGSVAIVNRKSRTVVRTIRVGGMPRRVAFDAAGSRAFVANEGNWVDVIR